MQKQLPPGRWFTIFGLPADATEESLQQLFLDRTGVLIETERIQVNPSNQRQNAIAIVSIPNQQLCEILTWAFSEDRPGGCPLKFIVPDGQKSR